MSDLLSCSWDEFKRMAKEFREKAPTLTIDELDNAWKCLSLGYLNMTEEMWLRSAQIVLDMESRTYLICKLRLAKSKAAKEQQV